jgi:hypothetical protein
MDSLLVECIALTACFLRSGPYSCPPAHARFSPTFGDSSTTMESLDGSRASVLMGSLLGLSVRREKLLNACVCMGLDSC